MTASGIVLILGVVFLLIAGSLWLMAKTALSTPPVHDGIGGKDTDNLMVGCLAPFVAMGCAACGVICLIVGGVVMLYGG